MHTRRPAVGRRGLSLLARQSTAAPLRRRWSARAPRLRRCRRRRLARDVRSPCQRTAAPQDRRRTQSCCASSSACAAPSQERLHSRSARQSNHRKRGDGGQRAAPGYSREPAEPALTELDIERIGRPIDRPCSPRHHGVGTCELRVRRGGAQDPLSGCITRCAQAAASIRTRIFLSRPLSMSWIGCWQASASRQPGTATSRCSPGWAPLDRSSVSVLRRPAPTVQD
jgi:hypothetical protein